jgi:mRNA interferase MazF
VRRGDILRLRLRRTTSHEQHGVRYGVVVRSDALLGLSTVLIAPTSTSARPASFRPEIEIDGTRTRVLVEQTGAVDLTRLGDYHGHLSTEEQWGVDLALETVLDLQKETPGIATRSRPRVSRCCRAARPTPLAVQ